MSINFTASEKNARILIERISDPENRILLWGFGPNTVKLLDLLRSCSGATPVGIFDTRIAKDYPSEMFGIPTVSPDNLPDLFPIDNTVIIVTCGLNELYGDIVGRHLFYYRVVHRRAIETAVSLIKERKLLEENLDYFADDESRSAYVSRIEFLIAGALVNNTPASLGKPYFNNDVIRELPETWFYAGLYDGRHFERAMRQPSFSSKTSLVGCEPSRRMAHLLQTKFSRNPNIRVENSLLWSVQGVPLRYNDDEENNGLSASVTTGAGRSYEVLTTTIDDVFQESNVSPDYISLDTEGSEIEVLKGATDTLSRSDCNLAVCVYHSYDDYCSIPGVLRELGGKIYIRQHSSIPLIETVAYLVRR